MTDALRFLSAAVNGAVTVAMLVLVVAIVVCALAPFFFGRNDR